MRLPSQVLSWCWQHAGCALLTSFCALISQAQLDGAPLAAAAASSTVLDDQHMLPMIEDELDAASRPWANSLRQMAGLPSVSALAAQTVTAAGRWTRVSTEPASFKSGSPLDGVVQLAARGRSSGIGSSSQQRASLDSLAAGYHQERMRHMAALLMSAGSSGQQLAAAF